MENSPKNSQEQRKQRKWSKLDTTIILDYLFENRNFEYPSAQVYYKVLLARGTIQATWNLVRWKVRNLRIGYFKARKFSKSEAATELERNEGSNAVQKKIYQTCPYYDTLHELFGDRCDDETKNQSSNTTTDSYPMDSFEVTWSSDTEEDIKPTIEPTQITVPMLPNTTDMLQQNDASNGLKEWFLKVPAPATNTTTTSLLANILQSPESPKIRKNIPPAADPIVATAAKVSAPTQRPLEVPRDNFEFEREKFKVNTKLEKRKLRLEERKFHMALEWQNKMFELRKMELESKEKIAILELELKYKNNNS